MDDEDKFYLLSDDADCLSDADVHKFFVAGTGRVKPHLKVKRAMVETYYIVNKYKEKTIIHVTPVRVLKDGAVVDVMADVVTGTLYRKTGECMSSDRRRVIKWEK